MSTQFRDESADVWAFVRWYGGRERGACVDFGRRVEHAEEVVEAAIAGHTFVDESGNRYHGTQILPVILDRPWTFGEFGGTFEVGTGDLATWSGL